MTQDEARERLHSAMGSARVLLALAVMDIGKSDTGGTPVGEDWVAACLAFETLGGAWFDDWAGQHPEAMAREAARILDTCDADGMPGAGDAAASVRGLARQRRA